jgi:hypothetical protein
MVKAASSQAKDQLGGLADLRSSVKAMRARPCAPGASG